MTNIEYIVFSFVIGSVFGWLMHVLFMRAAEQKALSMRNSIAGKAGRDIREQQEERLFSAIAKAGTLIKEGKTPMEAIKQVGLEYPDVAGRIISKFMKGQLPKELTELTGVN